MSKPLSCLLLLLHFLSPWVTLFFCASDMQKCHGKADNSTSCSESEREKKGGSPVHVLVTEPLDSFREGVKEKSFLPIPADQPPSSSWTHSIVLKEKPCSTLIYIWRCIRALMVAVYLHICHSIHIKPLLWSTLGYPRYEKYSTKPISILIQM